MKCGQIFFFVLFGNVLIPVFDICAIHAAAMQNIERLADICGTAVCGQHAARPMLFRCDARL